MRQSAVYRVFFLFLIIGLLSVQPLMAQAQNLLSNPGFEDNFVAASGIQPRSVAAGWTPWHTARTDTMPDYQNVQPKYQAAAPDSTRIRTGENAQQYFSFFETHEGGIYQRVSNLTAGTELRFSIYAYIWSSTYTDVNLSEDDGDVLVSVGIDPTGGTNPASSSIVWSIPVQFYDAYRQYSVIATAQGSSVTVFVRSQVGKPVWNSYIYLDDAELAQTTPGDQAGGDTGIISPTPQEVVQVSSPTPTASATNTDVPPTFTLTPSFTPSNTPTNPPTFTFTPSNTPTNPPTSTPTTAQAPANTGEDPTPTLEDVEPEEPTSTNTQAPTSPTLLPTSTDIAPDETRATDVPAVGGARPISETFPGTLIHTVRRGDTVAEIATLYGSTTEIIVEANKLNENALIFIGQGLIVPVRLANPATETPSPTPEIQPTAVVVVVTATVDPGQGIGGAVGGTVYTVQPGDTLSGLARRFNTTLGALVQLNGILNPNRIQVGQRIVVPATGGAVVPPAPSQPQAPAAPVVAQPVTYTVQPGDNLFRISLRFGVSMQRIGEANGILNANRVFVGQVLTIPPR